MVILFLQEVVLQVGLDVLILRHYAYLLDVMTLWYQVLTVVTTVMDGHLVVNLVKLELVQ